MYSLPPAHPQCAELRLSVSCCEFLQSFSVLIRRFNTALMVSPSHVDLGFGATERAWRGGPMQMLVG